MKQDVYEYDGYYKSTIYSCLGSGRKTDKNGIKVEPEFKYSSDTNKSWMKTEDLSDWIKVNSSEIGKI